MPIRQRELLLASVNQSLISRPHSESQGGLVMTARGGPKKRVDGAFVTITGISLSYQVLFSVSQTSSLLAISEQLMACLKIHCSVDKH